MRQLPQWARPDRILWEDSSGLQTIFSIKLAAKSAAGKYCLVFSGHALLAPVPVGICVRATDVMVMWWQLRHGWGLY